MPGKQSPNPQPLKGNVIEGFGGPAIVINSVIGLTIAANYFEGNDENAWKWTTAAGSLTTCSDIVLNGHGPDPTQPPNNPGDCNSGDCWENSTGYLHALDNDPIYSVIGAVIQNNFHQPGSLVQVNHACRGNKSSILAAAVDGLLVAGESALNAGVSPDGPFAEGGDSAGAPLVVTGTDPRTWTARNVHITSPGGYSQNNLLVCGRTASPPALNSPPVTAHGSRIPQVLRPDHGIEDAVDVVAGMTATIDGEPARDYGQAAANQSLWRELLGTEVSVRPAVRQLPAAESFEQQPSYEWRMPMPDAKATGAHTAAAAAAAAQLLASLFSCISSLLPLLFFSRFSFLSPISMNAAGGLKPAAVAATAALALSIDLSRTPSLAAKLEGGVYVPATIVIGLWSNVSCDGCKLHFAVRCFNTSSDGVAGHCCRRCHGPHLRRSTSAVACAHSVAMASRRNWRTGRWLWRGEEEGRGKRSI